MKAKLKLIGSQQRCCFREKHLLPGGGEVNLFQQLRQLSE
jgi:hypothetical protein